MKQEQYEQRKNYDPCLYTQNAEGKMRSWKMRSGCKHNRITATLTNQVKLTGCKNLNQEVKKMKNKTILIKNMWLQE